jgi:ABC-type nitrate/sulfonate/bicarbonate transport system permease component
VILAPHPGRVAHVVPMDLPWPRTAETRLTPAYEEQVARSRLLRGVQAAQAAEGGVDEAPSLVCAFNSVMVLAGLLALWQLCVIWLHVPKYMLPGPLNWWPGAVVNRFPALVAVFAADDERQRHGAGASIVVGVAIALVFAQWRWLRRLLFPYTILLQTVPIVAIAPLIIMWAGAGVFPLRCRVHHLLAPIIANTTQGLISVDENLIHLFLMHKATPAQVLFKLRLPHALPNLVCGHSHFRGHRSDWGDHRRVLCGFEPSWRRRTGLCDYSMPAISLRRIISLRWCGGDGAWFSFFFLGCFWSGIFCITGMSQAARYVPE